jgi:colanic acid/amylovoran biosynthesis glycosyltransferase
MSHAPPRICIVQPTASLVEETFLSAHAERLPGVVAAVYSHEGIPTVDGRPVLSQHWTRRGYRKAWRLASGSPWSKEIDLGFETAFRRTRAEVVLAEYGPVGVTVLDACRRAKVPLVVYFRGYDASTRSLLEHHRNDYQRLFIQAAAVVAVSQNIVRALIGLGCPGDKIFYNPSGFELRRFTPGNPSDSAAHFLAVGRLVQKKAPHLTILAFSELLRRHPQARLRIIGDGPLMGICRDLLAGLQIGNHVELLGVQPHDVVQREMQSARAFVQHSVIAASGDSEGTPKTILEAGASGLPVVATRHGGIPDVVIEGETGFLVDERDVAGMAEQMLRLAHDPALAASLGRRAVDHVRKLYTVDQSLERLSRILAAAANGQSIAELHQSMAAEWKESCTGES